MVQIKGKAETESKKRGRRKWRREKGRRTRQERERKT
jgi:hypothetical protein